MIKPSFTSFMLPIVQSGRRGLRTKVWGQVRPGTGGRWYRLQRLAGRHWVSIGHPTRTNVFGSYTRVIGAATGTRLRILYYRPEPASRARRPAARSSSARDPYRSLTDSVHPAAIIQR